MGSLHEKEKWELLADSLVSRVRRDEELNQGISPAAMEQALILIDCCLKIDESKPTMPLFTAASDVAAAYGLSSLEKSVHAHRKRSFIKKHLAKNHWQIALRQASTKDSLVYLYTRLREVRVICVLLRWHGPRDPVPRGLLYLS